MEQITEEDFRIYPEEVSRLAMFDGEDGEIFCWGHADKQELLDTLPKLSEYHGFVDGEYEGFTEDDISHQFATTKHKEADGEFWFTFCKESDEGSFPITVLHP